MANITDPLMYDAIRRAIMGPQSEMPVCEPAPTNVIDLRTGKPRYVPNELARTLQNISDAFKGARDDG
jgi:hypothetical protein